MTRYRARVLVAFLIALLAGCATLPENPPRGPHGYAQQPKPRGALANVERALSPKPGAEASGFRILDSNEDALRGRLALVDSAQHSLDIRMRKTSVCSGN